MQVAVIENSAIAPVGTFGDYLRRQRGAALTHIPCTDVAARAGEIAASDLVVSLGSDSAAYDPDPWIGEQRDLLARLVADGRAVIGICFGAQLLASALGGSVAPLEVARRRLGWVANDEVTAPVWGGPWVRWNFDHFTAPEGAEVLARSDGTIQAFRLRRALGVQFHPETVEAGLSAWIASSTAAELGGRDPAALRGALLGCLAAGLAARAREALFAEMLRLTVDA